GDVNGDGFDDLVVGAYRYDGDIVNEGAVYLYLGSESGLAATPHWMSTGGQSDAHYGWATAPAGDVNCDGYDDVIVGAYHYDNGSTDEGAAFVYYGGPSGLSATPDWTVEADQAGAQLGQWVGSAGDVNADGCDDVMIGADTYDGGEVDEGAVFIYYGSSSGPSLTPDWTAESNQADAYMTLVFDRVGDLNGDGIDDVAVGSPAYDNGQTDEGRVFVHYGSTSGPSAVADLEIELDVAGAWFGTLVSGAGDVNGDGIDDLLVGAPYYSNGEDSEGAVFVFLGTPTGLSPSYSWSFESNQRGAELGWAGGTAGDVDSDGFDDVIVGAWGYDGHRTDDGRVWVIQGSASGLSAQASWFMSGGQSGTELG
ncbi:MAG: integrin alpha, partial [Synechococcaceae cyanobacterium]|nr:integrin alpha [Synechococcaceae cyanobacterium]